MNITEEDIWKLMEEHLRTYNQQDLDGFMNTMSEDIEVHMLLTKQMIKGQKDVRALYEGVWKQYRGVKVEFTKKFITEKFVVVEETIVEAQVKELIGTKFVVVNEIVDGKIKRFWGFN
ncbi:MAG: nuclear transport factor 2 family protein [Asgard group archaeon]|nr:nuclear transport factor 2 family protein [Asgard group archaeon]